MKYSASPCPCKSNLCKPLRNISYPQQGTTLHIHTFSSNNHALPIRFTRNIAIQRFTMAERFKPMPYRIAAIEFLASIGAIQCSTIPIRENAILHTSLLTRTSAVDSKSSLYPYQYYAIPSIPSPLLFRPFPSLTIPFQDQP